MCFCSAPTPSAPLQWHLQCLKCLAVRAARGTLQVPLHPRLYCKPYVRASDSAAQRAAPLLHPRDASGRRAAVSAARLLAVQTPGLSLANRFHPDFTRTRRGPSAQRPRQTLVGKNGPVNSTRGVVKFTGGTSAMLHITESRTLAQCSSL